MTPETKTSDDISCPVMVINTVRESVTRLNRSELVEQPILNEMSSLYSTDAVAALWLSVCSLRSHSDGASYIKPPPQFLLQPLQNFCVK